MTENNSNDQPIVPLPPMDQIDLQLLRSIDSVEKFEMLCVGARLNRDPIQYPEY